MTRMMMAFSILIALSTQAACDDDAVVGGDSADMSTEDACHAYGTHLCDLACACSDACTYSMGSGTLGWNDESGCRDFYTVGCSILDPGEDFDFVGCDAVLDDATCEAGSDGMVLMHPACDTGT